MSNDSNKKTEKKKNTTKTTSTSSKNKINQNNNLSALTAITFTIALFGIIVALYGSFQAFQNRQQINDTFQTVQHNLETASYENKSLTTTVEQMKGAQRKLTEDFKRFDNNTRKALKEQRLGIGEWQMLKARYYLQLAQINAHFGEGQDETIELLNHADDVLSMSHNPDLFQVRQTIAKEIAQIKSSPKVDITGILSDLDAAQDAVMNLPVKKPKNNMNQKSQATKQSQNSTAWREKLKDSVHLLEKMVIVRKHEGGLKPLLSAQQESIARQSIGLEFQEAQWAVLNKNINIYQMALKQALKKIKRYFDKSSQPVQEMISQIEQLQQIKLNPPKPQLKNSLEQLNQLIEKNQNKPLKFKQNEKGGNS